MNPRRWLSKREQLYDPDDPPPNDGGAWYYLNRWAEEWLRWLRALGLIALTLAFTTLFWRQGHPHELTGIPPENQAWYQNAKTNPEARKTFPSPWKKCCNHAELIPVKDILFPNGVHGWQWNDNGTVKNIPDIIIHWNESAPDNQPTLFVYLGVMTCFYPPQGGV